MAYNDGLNEPEFIGQLILTNKTLSLRGTCVLLSNIIKFDQYGVPRACIVNNWHMLIAGIVICVFGPQFFWGLIFVIPAAGVIYAGIRERQKPELYGISLELTSGREYKLISRDIQGINLLVTRIKEAMRDERSLKYVVNFDRGKIIFNSDETRHLSNPAAEAV